MQCRQSLFCYNWIHNNLVFWKLHGQFGKTTCMCVIVLFCSVWQHYFLLKIIKGTIDNFLELPFHFISVSICYVLLIGTESETKEFMQVCVQTIQKYPLDDKVSPVFIFERLCSIIFPVSKELFHFLYQLTLYVIHIALLGCWVWLRRNLHELKFNISKEKESPLETNEYNVFISVILFNVQ